MERLGGACNNACTTSAFKWFHTLLTEQRVCSIGRRARLRTGANGHGLVVIVGAGGAVVEEVGPCLVVACRKDPHPVGALPGALRVLLGAVGQIPHQSRHRHWRLKHKPKHMAHPFLVICLQCGRMN